MCNSNHSFSAVLTNKNTWKVQRHGARPSLRNTRLSGSYLYSPIVPFIFRISRKHLQRGCGTSWQPENERFGGNLRILKNAAKIPGTRVSWKIANILTTLFLKCCVKRS